MANHLAVIDLMRQNASLVKSLEELVEAKALSSVRPIVAGWKGENRPDGPFEHRHPFNLGARIETRCGHMYELDEIMQRARDVLASLKERT